MAGVSAQSDIGGGIAHPSSPLLRVENLHVWFTSPGNGPEVHAVRGVTFEVAQGERLGLVGESGCGKSTTVQALMGLLPANAALAGRVLLSGRDLTSNGEQSFRSARWSEISLVFQGAMNAFNPVVTVGRQIAEPLKRCGAGRPGDHKRRVGELLEMVGVSASRADRYPHEFSGGMRQRAAIAMALACEPKILLADEPTTALDVMIQGQILNLLLDLSDSLGLAVIMVTHDLSVVAQLCHRAAVMYAGQICEDASMDALLTQSRHPYTRMLFDATPSLEVAESLAPIPGMPPRLDRAIEGCAFRPRCPFALPQCATRDPRMTIVGPHHQVACHLTDADD